MAAKNRTKDSSECRDCRDTYPEAILRTRPVVIRTEPNHRDVHVRGHIDGAKHVSRGVLEQKICEIAPDYSGPIVVYCAGGDRGALAADNLQKLGYQNVFSLKGGLSGWLEAGGLVETP